MNSYDDDDDHDEKKDLENLKEEEKMTNMG